MEFVEQRRRSRINEKMKALQNLIPNSNKVYISFVEPVYPVDPFGFLAELFDFPFSFFSVPFSFSF